MRPRNIFGTKTFYTSMSIVLAAISFNVAEMIEKGVTVERVIIVGSVLSASAANIIDRFEKEVDLVSPDGWAGRSASDVLATPEPITIKSENIQLVDPAGDLQSATLTTTVKIDPIQEAIDDVVKNPIGVAINPIGAVKNALGKLVGGFFK